MIYCDIRSYCQIHPVVADFLLQIDNHQQQSESNIRQHKKNLHTILLNQYRNRWGEYWWLSQEQYLQQHLVYHLIQIEEDQMISQLMLDIAWADANMKTRKSIISLIEDLKQCQQYLVSKVIFTHCWKSNALLQLALSQITINVDLVTEI